MRFVSRKDNESRRQWKKTSDIATIGYQEGTATRVELEHRYRKRKLERNFAGIGIDREGPSRFGFTQVEQRRWGAPVLVALGLFRLASRVFIVIFGGVVR